MAPQMLQIPLRARLTTPQQNNALAWRQILALMRLPEGMGLLHHPLPKLPSYLRK